MPPEPAPPPSRIGLGLVIFATLIVAVLNIAMLTGPNAKLLLGDLSDSDAYMRLLRVQELWEGAGWFNTVSPRLSAPEGLSLHWTRPLDVLILLPARALVAFGLPQLRALELAGILVSPVLHVGAAVAAAWGARALWGGLAPYYAVLMLVATPAATAYSLAGRADHHTLLLLALTLGLAASVRALAPAHPPRMAWLAGASFAFGIWVGPEALLLLVPVLAATGLAVLVAADGRALARQGMHICLGMLAMLLVAIVVERHPTGWLDVEYDKVSIQHAALALLAGGVFAVTTRLAAAPRPARIAGAGAAAAIAFGILLLLFPGALLGALGGADAVTMEVFHPVVEEMQPLPPFGPGAPLEAAMYVGGPALAGLVALGIGARGFIRDGRWPGVLALVAALLVCLIASFAARRFALDLAAPAAISAAGLVGLLIGARRPESEALRGLLAALGLAATLGLPAVGLLGAAGASTSSVAERSAAAGCDATALIRWLGQARPAIAPGNPAPVLMMDNMFNGPELVWRTPYRVVAAPYLRAGPALADLIAVLQSQEETAARAVLSRRGVALLLVCRAAPAVEVVEGALGAAIRDDAPPAWLQPVPLPETLSGYRLYGVTPEGAR